MTCIWPGLTTRYDTTHLLRTTDNANAFAVHPGIGIGIAVPIAREEVALVLMLILVLATNALHSLKGRDKTKTKTKRLRLRTRSFLLCLIVEVEYGVGRRSVGSRMRDVHAFVRDRDRLAWEAQLVSAVLTPIFVQCTITVWARGVYLRGCPSISVSSFDLNSSVLTHLF